MLACLFVHSRCKRRVYLAAACAYRKYNISGKTNCWDDATLPRAHPCRQWRATACTIRGMDCAQPAQNAPPQRLTIRNIARYDLSDRTRAVSRPAFRLLKGSADVSPSEIPTRNP
ncbi:hypothetical protein MASSI9I_20080 [Massilia sp. 9I]|nr:hypothetical protein MASSI9I_20080 [Massilia sp. 9I]